MLEGTQALEFGTAEDDEGRYRWIEAVLWRLDYRGCGAPTEEPSLHTCSA